MHLIKNPCTTRRYTYNVATTQELQAYVASYFVTRACHCASKTQKTETTVPEYMSLYSYALNYSVQLFVVIAIIKSKNDMDRQRPVQKLKGPDRSIDKAP